jgi:hypothetical protein
MSSQKSAAKAEATAREYLDRALAKQRKLGAPPVSPERYERALKQATASFEQLYKAARLAR